MSNAAEPPAVRMIDGPANRPSRSQASATSLHALHQRADDGRVARRVAGDLQAFVALEARQRDDLARRDRRAPRASASSCVAAAGAAARHAELEQRRQLARHGCDRGATASIAASCASESTRKWNSRSGCSSLQADHRADLGRAEQLIGHDDAAHAEAHADRRAAARWRPSCPRRRRRAAARRSAAPSSSCRAAPAARRWTR